MTLECTEID